MTKEHLEKEVGVQNSPEKYDYQRYLELGGIINEKDYNGALERVSNTTVNEITIGQVEPIKNFAKIESLNQLAVKLYGILRSGKRLEDAKYHHSEMGDPKLLREALRMLEDTDALDKMKTAYHTNRPPGTYCPLCGQTRENKDCP